MKKSSGFSMMEMMIVLLIIVIIAAAIAPTVSKKLLNSFGNKEDGCLWQSTNFNIRLHFASLSHSNETHKKKQVSIGRETPFPFQDVKFYVSADDRGQISIGDGVKQLIASVKGKSETEYGPPADSFYFNSKNYDENMGRDNTVIGIGTDSSKKNFNTLLGNGIVSENDYTTIVGTNIKRKFNDNNPNRIATALGANIDLGQAIAIGTTDPEKPIQATGKQSIAIGTSVFRPSTAHVHDFQDESILSSTGEKSIAIGAGARATTDNSIAIGSAVNFRDLTDSKGYYQRSTVATNYQRNIAIGSGCTAEGRDSIAIGSTHLDKVDGNYIKIHMPAMAPHTNSIEFGEAPTKAVQIGSIALGRGAIAGATNAIAIGKFSRAAVNQVGDEDVNEQSFNATAIGYHSRAYAANSVAIGPYARATKENQIVLGTKNSTVYIPGNLVVGRNAVLGTDRWDAWSALRIFTDGTNDEEHSHLRILSVHSKNIDNMYWGTHFGNKNYFNSTFVDQYIGSDRRLKNVGEEFKSGLEQIKKLKTFNYTYKKDPNKIPRVGVIAQDLQKIFPQAVMKGEDGFLRIRMEDMFYAVVNAVKELDAMITALNNTEIKQLQDRVAVLKKQNKELLKQRKKLEKRLHKLEKRVIVSAGK